ncbi:hypothetical protein ABVT39_009292 [Epinephelus coioides]
MHTDIMAAVEAETGSILAKFGTEDLTKIVLITIKAAVPAIVKGVQKQLDPSVDKMKVNNNILECKYKEDELEQYSRKENIRINGMEEQSGEESEDQLIEKVCNLAAAPGSVMKEEDMSMAHRLGGVKKQRKMRPVIVRFVSRRKKADLIKLKENDTYKKVFICEDLTNMRYKLFRYAKGKCDLTFVRDGKIISKKDGKYITIDNPDDLFLTGYVNVDYKDFGIDKSGVQKSHCDDLLWLKK